MANTVRNMHYDFKQKLNKVDSNQNKNFQVPEIDWKLNEAMGVFIKQVAHPKFNPNAGTETSQRSIDAIRPLIIENYQITAIKVPSENVYSATLPPDYMIHLSSSANCTKATCVAKIRTTLVQHDDKEDAFYSSNFEWRDVNVMFAGNSLRVLTDGTFTVDKVYLSYVRHPKWIHSAVDFVGGSYAMPDGETVLTGYQECELPLEVHSEIVDLAVLITTGDLIPSYQVKQAKTQIS